MKAILVVLAALCVVAIAQENQDENKCEIDKPRMVDYCRGIISLAELDESLRYKLWDMEMDELFDLMYMGLAKFGNMFPEYAEKARLSAEYFKNQQNICGF